MVTSQRAWPLKEGELRPALRLVVGLARADMGILMLHDDGAGLLVPVIGHGLSDAQCALFGAHRPDEGLFAKATAEHRLVRVRDAARHPSAFQAVARSIGFRHAELLPFFRCDGRLLGAFATIYRRRHGSPRALQDLETCCCELIALALEEALARAQADRATSKAADVARAKMQFLARLSHELRTPLQSILGYVELLRTGVTVAPLEGQTPMLDRVDQGARGLISIINDVTTFAQLEAGGIPYSVAAVSPRLAVLSAESIVSPLASENGIRLQVDRCGRELQVRADEEKLKQILVNLMANAVKFTPSGGTVRLSYRVEHDAVCFDVADTGPGIPSDKQKEIFRPYVQLSTPGRAALHGSGLGLAISQEFAAAMKGTLSVASTVGKGSVFTLRLPRAPNAEERTASHTATPDTRPSDLRP